MSNTLNKTNTLLLIVALLPACTTSPPKNIDNICSIFREKDDWYDYSKDSFEKWGVPIHVQMAIINQESRFVADALPPRPYLLGFIPWFRSSSAYGYPQAQDGTWEWYLDDTGRWIATRDDFADATDFVGWYCSVSNKKLGISKWDAKNQYLAYHEGHTGFHRKSYLQKRWLLSTSEKVARKANTYRTQLETCREEMESSGWFFW